MNKWLNKGMKATLSLALAGGMLLTANSAFAASRYVTPTQANRIIHNAERIQNKVQYHWGVNNPRKMWFDCSSFTKYLYAKQGIKLRWGARLQYADSKKIAKRQLRKGDLVFLSTPASAHAKTKYGRIGHVGIYIGHGKFIHNLTPKYDVTISNLNKGYWKKHYVAAGRV